MSGDEAHTVGLLVVHGMGEQKQGQTAEKLLEGLDRAATSTGTDLTIERHDDPIHVATATLPAGAAPDGRDRVVNVYEVHWADVLDDVAIGSFQVETLGPVSWFPSLNRKRRIGRRGLLRLLRTILWTVVLVPATFLVFLGYQGAHLLFRIFEDIRRDAAEKKSRPNVGFRDILRREARGSQARVRTKLDDLLDRSMGDVFTYVNAAGDAFGEDDLRREAADRILMRFYAALRAAWEDGCDEIQILAHSLGTVVTYHALTGYRLVAAPQAAAADPVSRLTALYTIGSPLDKIRYIWPGLFTEDLLGPVEFGDGLPRPTGPAGAPRFRWLNFYGLFDVVGAALDDFGHWDNLTNARIWEGGAARSHVVYERNRRFLGAITEGLFGVRLEPKSSLGRRTWGVVSSLLETAALVLGIAVLIALGAALLFVVAGLLPWLIENGLDLIGLDGAAGWVADWGFVIMAAMVLFVLMIGAPFAQAVDDHKPWADLYRRRHPA